ncbi:MAG: HupE/UreJ family protein [Proteobacteria bacterium]|nr:HupE/UreJ family protein [Pseudomonadota bacterium]MDA0928026.1 HupE/UreJ family protein [Pseudomonadota bacterium]
MSRGRVIAALILMLLSTATNAHLLNMTDLHFDASDPEAVLLHIKIDLGQSLLSPVDYWRAVNSDPAEQYALIAPAAGQLLNGMQILIGGTTVSGSLQSWSLEAASLEAIENSLSPQMAILSFDFGRLDISPTSEPADSSLELFLDEQLEIPWPALLRVDTSTRALPVSRLLTANDRRSRPISLIDNIETTGSSAMARLAISFQAWVPGLSWLAIGFQHIIPWGLDHIAFVLGLFFLSTRISTLFYQVSCFTVAHSLTLGLATLGWISVPASIIEPLIAASIVFIAVDNLYNDLLGRWRLLVVTLFGLLHGLGFASALSELMLPAENFYMALLMFNLGVEAGQLTVLALAFAAVGWLRGRAAYNERVARPATVTIAGVGTYWLLKRVAF